MRESLRQGMMSHRYARSISSQNSGDMIRLDRAVLYVYNEIKSLIDGLVAKDTKYTGEMSNSIHFVVSRVRNLSYFSPECEALLSPTRFLVEINERTPRKLAIERLHAALAEMERVKEIVERDLIDEKVQDSIEKESEESYSITDINPSTDAFVIMPFNKDFSDVWSGGIQKAAKAKGVRAIRVDMISKSSNINDDIINSIKKVEFVIADVTGGNPNVMYELGYAMLLGKEYVIISQNVGSLPFDIKNIRTILYNNTWSGIEDLRRQIEEYIAKSNIAKHKSPRKKP